MIILLHINIRICKFIKKIMFIYIYIHILKVLLSLFSIVNIYILIYKLINKR